MYKDNIEKTIYAEMAKNPKNKAISKLLRLYFIAHDGRKRPKL